MLVRLGFDNFPAIICSVDTFLGGRMDGWKVGWTETVIIELTQSS